MKLILAGSAAVCVWLGWRSLGWPLVHDAPIMHYIAWLIAQGAVPYRDVFDMNLPGVYLVHWLVLSTGGAGDVAWRVFDLLWLTLVCIVLYAYCRPLGSESAAVAPALFALYHLSGGAWRAGQRDVLLCLFVLLGALGTARFVERGGLLPLMWAGAALGAGMTIKPQAGMFWLACAAVSARAGWRQRGSALKPAITVVATGLAAPAIVFGWLAWRGGLASFVAMVTGYLLPLYSHVGRVSVWQALGWPRYGWQLVILTVALAVLALCAPPVASGARKPLAILGMAYGWLHYHLQGKGWEYHLYPLALFVCALAPFAVMRVAGEARQGAILALRRPIALVAWAALVVVLGAKGADAVDAPWIAEKTRRVAALTRDLAPLVTRGGTVQVMDVTEGGLHALLRLHARQPTRFIYDFHFFHDVGDPRIQALRSEFLGGLVAGRPVAVVVLRDTWNREGYERVDELPGVKRFLDDAYLLAVDGDGYRIYAKRADP